MTVALLTAVISVLAGLAAAIAAHARLWVLAPVRAFAVVAVAAAIAVHSLPESIDGAGWWVLAPFALGFVAPPLIGAVSRAAARGHRRLAAELSYGGVLVHQLGDGLGLGTLTRDAQSGHVQWDFVVGLGAHTVPLVAIIALAFAELGGPRAALVRAAGLLAATLAGIALTRLDAALMADVGPWLSAAVSGLLFHVLLHDADDRDVPRRARPLEALGAAAGAALPWITAGHDHGALTAAIRHGAGDVAIALAPVLVIGGLFATLLAPHQRRSPASIVALAAGPPTALALLAATYIAAAHDAATGAEPGVLSPVPEVIGIAAAALLAALALGRIATAGFMTWMGRGHRHDHDHDHG